MNTRLKQFLAAENITQAQFADNINVVRASVSHVLSGRNNPSYDFIRSIMVKYPELNIEWLMFGKGKMYKETCHSELIPDSPPAEPQETLLFNMEDDIEEGKASTNEINTLNIPIQTIVNQRKVSKIIVLFDDGTFQEL